MRDHEHPPPLRRGLGLVGGVALLAFVVPLAYAQEPVTCFGERATIVGTDGDDRLEGTPERDVIAALDGVDFIVGRGGDDLICAGPGAEEREDEEFGTYIAGDGASGGSGHDRIDMGPGPNFASGDGGKDEILGSDEAEYSDNFDGNAGDDLIAAGEGWAHLDGGDGNDDITSGDEDDLIDLGKGHDVLDAGPGDDHITPVQGDDEIDGGDGVDLVDLYWVDCGRGCRSSHTRPLHVDLVRGVATGMGTDTLTNVENVWGGDGDDRLFGDQGPNLLGGSDDQAGPDADHNIIDGRGGDDTLLSSTGRDTIEGGEGSDTITFAINECSVRIDLREGTVTPNERNPRHCKSDRISGIENAESSGTDIFIGDDGPNVFLGGFGEDRARGGGGDDTLTGGSHRDILRGGPGEDSLMGGLRPDDLFGGEGDDKLDGGASASNSNDGGPGIDSCTRPSSSEGAINCEA